MDAKALLDSLMGPSRDKSKAEKKTDEWKGKDVCKRYLVGFCPNNHLDNWFHNTKRDVGTCKKIHSDALKDQFLKSKDKEKYEEEYEMEFLKYLEALNGEADAWIAREKGNCAGQGKTMKMTNEHKNQMEKMQREVDTLLKEAEEKADKGDISGSKQSTEIAKQKQEEITTFKETHSFMPKGDSVCDVCGIRNNLDDPQALESHMTSNLHMAYVKTRARAKELREKLRNAKASTRIADENGVTAIDKDKSRRDRSRSRDRRRDRDRSRDRKEGDRDRDRGKEKERDRDRDKERDRERKSRSRDRRRR